jgi:prevent-host-death family protein
MTVNVHEAKTQLSALIERALAGEEVIIARAGHPVVTLKPIAAMKKGRQLGAARGLTSEVEGWERPMADSEADEFLGIRSTGT